MPSDTRLTPCVIDPYGYMYICFLLFVLLNVDGWAEAANRPAEVRIEGLYTVDDVGTVYAGTGKPLLHYRTVDSFRCNIVLCYLNLTTQRAQVLAVDT